MAYVKIIFQNSPSTATPMNAQNLNHMDDQIALNDQRLTEIETSYVKSFNGRKGEVIPEDGDYNIGQIAPLTGAQVGQVPVVTNIGTEEDPELVFRMGAGGGGGHSIIDSEGNTMPQETAMQFADSFVSDDSTNGKTVVENIKEHDTQADYDNATEDGFHVIDDGNDVPIGASSEDYVSVTASSDTYRSLINKLRDEIDFSKVTDYSYIKLNGKKFICTNHDSGELQFTNAIAYSPTSGINTIFIFPTDDGRYYTDTMQNGSAPTVADSSTSNVTDGKTLTLYYGTSSTVINLKTSADYCMMSDGQTVEEACGNYVEYDLNDYVNTSKFDAGYTGLNKIRVMGNLAIFSISGISPKGTSSGTIAYQDLPVRIKGYIAVPLTNGTHNNYVPISIYYDDATTLKIDLNNATVGDKYFGELVTFIER